MKKAEQKIITAENATGFNYAVNTYLEKGWTVVDGTLKIVLCHYGSMSYAERWAVVLEKLDGSCQN